MAESQQAPAHPILVSRDSRLQGCAGLDRFLENLFVLCTSKYQRRRSCRLPSVGDKPDIGRGPGCLGFLWFLSCRRLKSAIEMRGIRHWLAGRRIKKRLTEISCPSISVSLRQNSNFNGAVQWLRELCFQRCESKFESAFHKLLHPVLSEKKLFRSKTFLQ